MPPASGGKRRVKALGRNRGPEKTPVSRVSQDPADRKFLIESTRAEIERSNPRQAEQQKDTWLWQQLIPTRYVATRGTSPHIRNSAVTAWQPE